MHMSVLGRAASSTAACEGATGTCPPSSVQVGLCQTAVGADKDVNIATARAAVRNAASEGAELVVLGECNASWLAGNQFASSYPVIIVWSSFVFTNA